MEPGDCAVLLFGLFPQLMAVITVNNKMNIRFMQIPIYLNKLTNS